MSNTLEDLKYAELQALAKESGVKASGTKEDLVAALTEAGVAGPAATDDSEDEVEETSEEVVNETPAPAAINATERVETKKAERELRADAKAMKAHLDKQKKVSIMIPFEVGENPENGKKVKFHVNLNGYALDIPRGIYVEVPEQIADMVKARLESEGKIGSEWRIDRDAAKQTALNLAILSVSLTHKQKLWLR